MPYYSNEKTEAKEIEQPKFDPFAGMTDAKATPTPSSATGTEFSVSKPDTFKGMTSATTEKKKVAPSDFATPEDFSFYDKAIASLTLTNPVSVGIGATKLFRKKIEGAANAGKLSYKIADLSMVQGKLGYKQLMGTATDTENQYLERTEAQIQDLVQKSQSDPYIAKSVGSILPFLKESALKGGYGALWGGVLAGTMGVIAGNLSPLAVTPEEVVTVPALASIGAKIGSTFSSLENMRQIETGSAYRSLIAEGLDPNVASVAARGYGAVSTGLEAGAFKLLTKMLPGSKQIAKNVITKALNKNNITKLLHVSTGEAGIESSQQFTQNLISEVARIANDELKDTKLSQHEKEGWVKTLTDGVGDTFAQTLVGFGVVGAVGVPFKSSVDKRYNIGNADKKGYPTPEDLELDKTWSEGQTKVTASTKESKKPAKPGPKPDGETSKPPLIDKITEPEIKSIEMEPSIFNEDGVEDTETTPHKISLTKEDLGSSESWTNLINQHLTKEELVQIVGGQMAIGAEKIKVQPKDLRQPAVMLYDGTILKGPQVDYWTISNPAESITQIPKSWAAAREVARNNGFDLESATEGFIAKGKFVTKQQAGEKVKVYEKVEAVKEGVNKAVSYYEQNPKATYQEAMKDAGVSKRVAEHAKSVFLDLQTMTGELDTAKEALNKENLSNLRKATQEDRLAVSKVKQDKRGNVIRKAVNRVLNSSLGKQFDKSELTGVAQAALWEFIRRSDPELINTYVNTDNKAQFKGTAYQAMRWALMNYIKANIGQGIGMTGSQVTRALKEGKLFTSLSLDESLVTSTREQASDEGVKPTDIQEVTLEGQDATKRSKSIFDNQIKDDAVDEADRAPSEVKKISVEEYNKLKEQETQRDTELSKQSALKGNKSGIAQTIAEDKSDQERLRELQQKERDTKVKLKAKSILSNERGTSPEITQLVEAIGNVFTKLPDPYKLKNVYRKIDLFEKFLKKKYDDGILDRVSDYEIGIPTKENEKLPITKLEYNVYKKLYQQRLALTIRENIVHKAFSNLLKKVQSGYNKSISTLDVEYQWAKIGAKKVGFTLKNIYSRQDVEERHALKDLDNFNRKIKEGFGKYNVEDQDLMNVVLVAELPAKMKNLDPEYQAKIKPAVEWFQKYFTDKQQQLKDRGINVDYRQRMLTDIDEELKLMESDPDTKKNTDPVKMWERRQKLLSLRQDISGMQFVHIPLKVWFDTQIKAAKKSVYASDIGGYKKAKAKLKLLTSKKRHASLINYMYDREILTPKDINPVSIIMNYARRFGHDMAIADVRDAAVEEGLIKVRKSKPKGDFVPIPQRLAALQVKTKPGEHAYISQRVKGYLDDALTAKFSHNIFTKMLSIVKMTQFYNPFILPMYDIFQSAMATIQYPGFWGSALKRTIIDISNKTDNYYALLENGIASKPFAMPFDEWMRAADIKTCQAKGHNIASSWARAWGKEMVQSPGSFIKTGLKTPLIAGWISAWTMDEYIRIFTGNVLQEAGLSTHEAAQTAAKFHGDYASVPTSTRRVLNNVFFTPTFKIAMSKLYISMIKGTVDNIVSIAKDPKNTKTDVKTIYAQGFLTLIALDIARDTLLKSLGFEEDKWFRRYKKLIWTDEGPKELIVTLSDPANLPFKLYYTFIEPIIDYFTKENKVQIPLALEYAFRFELNPFWQMLLRLQDNKTRGGSDIVTDFDPLWVTKENGAKISDTRAYKYGKFFIREFYNVIPALMNAVSSAEDVDNERRAEAKAAIKRDYNTWIGLYFDWVTFTYTRSAPQIRTSGQLDRLKRDFRYLQNEYVKNHGKINEVWESRYQKMITEYMKVMEDAD